MYYGLHTIAQYKREWISVDQRWSDKCYTEFAHFFSNMRAESECYILSSWSSGLMTPNNNTAGRIRNKVWAVVWAQGPYFGDEEERRRDKRLEQTVE